MGVQDQRCARCSTAGKGGALEKKGTVSAVDSRVQKRREKLESSLLVTGTSHASEKLFCCIDVLRSVHRTIHGFCTVPGGVPHLPDVLVAPERLCRRRSARRPSHRPDGLGLCTRLCRYLIPELFGLGETSDGKHVVVMAAQLVAHAKAFGRPELLSDNRLLHCLCLVVPLLSWPRHCLCRVFPLSSWPRQCLCLAFPLLSCPRQCLCIMFSLPS